MCCGVVRTCSLAGSDSAAAPTGASGLNGQQSCYWNDGVNCTVSPPSVTGNLLWTLHVLHQSGLYQGNSTVSTDVVWPLLVRAIRFYTHFMIENASHITLPPTFSPEYPAPAGPNANYDLALLRWGTATALQLASQYSLTAPDRPIWERIHTKLVGPSLDKEGRYAIYEGTGYDKPHRHFSHLLPLWPLREQGNLTDPVMRQRALASVDRWSSLPELGSLFGRAPCASMNADLGRHADALDNMTYFARTRIDGGGWYWEGAATICNEATYLAGYTLADWLLQSWNETNLAGAGPGGAPVKILELFRGAPDSVRLDDGAYVAAPSAIATGSFYQLAAEGGFLVSAAREQDLTSSDPAVYKARTSFVAIESTVGGPCVLRTDMPRPLHTSPAGVELTELGDGGVVKVGIEKSESIAIWGGSTVPPLVISPKQGCPHQQNFWGGGVVINPEARAARQPDDHNKTVLKPCNSDADGALVASQRWRRVECPAGAVAFELDDGSGRCLTVADCAGAGKDTSAVLRPCIQPGQTAAPEPIGCQRPWSQADEWPRSDTSGPGPDHKQCSAESQEFLVGSGPPHYWPNAIEIKSVGCLGVHEALHSRQHGVVLQRHERGANLAI